MVTRHRLFKLLAALIVLLGFALGPMGAAPAAAASVAYIIRPIETTGITLVVEDNSRENGARIVLGDARPGAFENWMFIPVKDTRDTFYIQSVESGKVMSINSPEPGAPVLQWDNQYVPEQQWLQIWAAEGYKFRNVYTGLYMDVKGESTATGTPIIQWYQTTGRNQQFRLVPADS